MKKYKYFATVNGYAHDYYYTKKEAMEDLTKHWDDDTRLYTARLYTLKNVDKVYQLDERDLIAVFINGKQIKF